MSERSFQQRREHVWDAEDAILARVTHAMPSADVVSALQSEHLDDYAIRAAIWSLIGRGCLELRRADSAVLLAKP
ncbi:MAG: hypothetical protein ACR2OO_17030 [Thermomicrobiales bacterium]